MSERTYGQDYSTSPGFWQDDGDDVKLSPVRRNTLVLPEKPQTVAYPVNEPTPTVIVERVFEAMPGADEKTSGIDRSNALIVRMLPMGCVWVFLAFAVAMVAASAGGGRWGFVMFAVVLAVTVGATWLYMDRQERQYSRAGLERHRIDTAAALKAQELAQQHELRKAALAQYIKSLEDSDR
jgi:hypothetical protein